MVSYIAKLDGSMPELARSELQHVTKSTLSRTEESFVFFDVAELTPKHTRLALTQGIYKILCSGTEAKNVLTKINSSMCSPSYKLHIHDLKGDAPSITELANQLHEVIDHPVVDIHNPARQLYFFFTDDSVLFAEKIFGRNEQFNERKAHHLPGQHPTTMNPKLARTMINLSEAEAFHDPFCGSGGIVIEGALLGLDASGSDIVPAMISRAKANAQYIGVDADFSVADALHAIKTTPAIISDLPYGKNAVLSEDKETLYKQFFIHAQSLTSCMVLGTNIDPKSLLEDTSWVIEEQFSVYVHKSLTRTISLFKLHDGK